MSLSKITNKSNIPWLYVTILSIYCQQLQDQVSQPIHFMTVFAHVDCAHHIMLRWEPMQRGNCNFTASCKPLISSQQVQLHCSNLSSICHISTWELIVDVLKVSWFQSMIYLTPPFSEDKTPHVSGSLPQTRAWHKSFDGRHVFEMHSSNSRECFQLKQILLKIVMFVLRPNLRRMQIRIL